MGFSLSGGLSSMGKAISTTAGDMIVSEQRAQLDRERLELAEKLAEGRESRRDERQSVINAAAADKDRGFRSDQAALNREHDLTRDTKREEGDDRRARMTNARSIASDAAAAARHNEEMRFRFEEAKDRARTAEEKRILDSALASSTKKVPMTAPSANGEGTVTRYVDVTNYVEAAGKLRDTGHENLAAPLFAKPKPGAKSANVTGKPKPPLGSVADKYHTADHGGD